MERRKENTSLPLWRKDAHGTLMLVGHPTRIKPKEEVRLAQETIGKFINKFELLQDGKGKNKVDKKLFPEAIAAKEKAAPIPDKDEYKVEHVQGGWYNVVSGEGKVMNESKLRSADAETLKLKLEEEQKEE